VASSLRQTRERELVAATRALFDERGMQDAPIEEIAQSVGIARGLIYRQFSSKEELFVLTVTDYLDELAGLMEHAIAQAADDRARLESCAEAYAAFCLRYPAFLDCSMSLMQRPAAELERTISPSVYLRLGQGMARCLEQFAAVLRAFPRVEDPDYTANLLWTQMLGAMHLARIRVGVRQAAPGVPALFRVEPERIVRSCVDGVMALVS
jgi:AcrR family transcriptional regulator